MLSDDGALTTTLVGILAERELAVTPLEATVFALGIHEDTGSLTYRDRDAARRRGARLVPASRGAPGDDRALPAPAARRRTSARCSTRCSPRSRPHGVGGVDVLARRGRVADVRRRRLEPRPQDRRPHRRRALVCLVEMDGRVVGGLPQPNARGRRVRARRRPRRRRVTRRRRRRRSTARSTRPGAAVLDALPQAVREPLPPRAQVMSRPRALRLRPTTRSRTRWCSASATARAASRSGTPEDLAGVVTREDLDKAIGHGLSHAPGQGDHGLRASSTCDETTPAGRAARGSSATAHAGRVPVLRDGEVVGRRHAGRRAARARRAGARGAAGVRASTSGR